ncbi:hypothetical protein AcW1_000653 [Taiwanofungus camphoratus]|nr:hypothetical protein AcV5_004552 [Antrodia cinnamomea]KAI0963627.1 hypothetical protein AcW1_000653 [Antrodia cinnamomea]
MDDKKSQPNGSDLATLAGPSTNFDPPPSFEESAADQVAGKYGSHFTEPDVFVPLGGEEPPPEFTPYDAKYFVSGSSEDIVSHDRHLNEDGEALYRFLLSHSQTPPTVFIHLHGSHTESRTRLVTRRDSNGNYRTEDEHYTEEVTDFDFSIDVGQHIAHGPVHWSLPDEEPAYRGKMFKEIDCHNAGYNDMEMGLSGLTRRAATKDEIKQSKIRQNETKMRGLPPWAGLESINTCDGDVDSQQTSVLKSSRTLRQWADEYCASNKLLKEFTYEKIVCGWNFPNLHSAIVAAVKSTYYSSHFTVEFRTTHAKIYVRPDNVLSRTLSNKWLKFLLFILLIYPFIWLCKRYGERGGGRWEVCGGAYALKSWQLVDSSSDLPPSFPDHDDGRTMQTSAGLAKLVGLREGEWFQQWEGTIRRAVSSRLKSSTPLRDPDERPSQAAMMLDGYRGNASTISDIVDSRLQR